MQKIVVRILSAPLFALALAGVISGAAIADPPAGSSASQRGLESSAAGGANGHHRCGGNSGQGQGNECNSTAGERGENMRQRREGMSEEERTARQAKMKERFDSMSPEQRQAMQEKRKERWQNMSAEEKMARRNKMKDRFEASPSDQAQRDKWNNGHHRCGGNSGQGGGNECTGGTPGNSDGTPGGGNTNTSGGDGGARGQGRR